MKNKNENKKITYNYSEGFKTNKLYHTEEELKTIFNIKYFNYIKNFEKRALKNCIFEQHTQ